MLQGCLSTSLQSACSQMLKLMPSALQKCWLEVRQRGDQLWRWAPTMAHRANTKNCSSTLFPVPNA